MERLKENVAVLGGLTGVVIGALVELNDKLLERKL